MSSRVQRALWPFPRVLGHRGGGTLAPENTLAGLRTASHYGFQGVEFDAKLTRDGVAILLHDDTLDRTTNGGGPVAQADWVALRCLDAGGWRDARFTGEPIPTLEAALRLCHDLGLWPNVEIKPCPGREEETGAVVARQVLRHWQGVTPPLLSSFSPVSLAAARDEARELPRALLVGDVPVDWREQIDRLDCFALHCHYRAATQAFLAQAAAHARPVLCYTVNRAALARKLQSLGVSALVTDRLDLIPPAAAL
jgi:glycerophosphoryl diester phosphodiesterase